MNLAVISSLGFKKSMAQTHNLLWELSLQNLQDTVIVDNTTITHYQLNNTIINPEFFCYFIVTHETSLTDLIDFSNGLTSKHIVLIDAQSCSEKQIDKFLLLARKVWFELEEWPSLFAIICTEVEILSIAELLTHTFYIQPTTLSAQEIYLYVRSIKRRAFILRWLGPGKTLNILNKIYRIANKIRTYLRQKIK